MKLIKKISISILLSIFVSQLGVITYSQFIGIRTNFAGNIIYAEGDTNLNGGHSGSTNLDGGNSSGNSIELENPLKDGGIEDIPTFVQKLLEVVMKVGVPLIAVAIIYTGYLFIAAQGNPEKLKKAKDAMLYVLVGSIILLGAYVIAQALQGTINAIRGN